MLVASEISPAKLEKVERTHAVIVGTVSAGAAVLMRIMVPVLLLDDAAFRATLGSVSRAHLDDFCTGTFRLVGEELLKLIESPRAQVLLLLLAAAQVLLIEGDAGQILKDEERTLAIPVNECLRYPMVHIGHPTVLSLPDGADFPLRALRIMELEPLPQFGEMVPLVHDGTPALEDGFALAVRCRDDEVEPSVDADDGLDGRILDFRQVLLHGDAYIPALLLADNLCRADCPSIAQAFLPCGRCLIRDLDGPIQRRQSNPPVFQEPIVSVADLVALRGTEMDRLLEPFQRALDFYPFAVLVLIAVRLLGELFFRGLVPCRGGFQCRNHHLGIERILRPDIMVYFLLQGHEVQDEIMLENPIRHILADIPIEHGNS